MKSYIIMIFLITLGCFKAVADIFEFKAISAAGAALSVSPAMKVFTAHDGYETFSPTYSLYLQWNDGTQQRIDMDKSLYQKLSGPYNRRNVYGAMLSYGPVLATNPHSKTMYKQMADTIFCHSNQFLNEIGIETKQTLNRATIIVNHQKPQRRNDLPARLEINCEQ